MRLFLDAPPLQAHKLHDYTQGAELSPLMQNTRFLSRLMFFESIPLRLKHQRERLPYFPLSLLPRFSCGARLRAWCLWSSIRSTARVMPHDLRHLHNGYISQSSFKFNRRSRPPCVFERAANLVEPRMKDPPRCRPQPRRENHPRRVERTAHGAGPCGPW